MTMETSLRRWGWWSWVLALLVMAAGAEVAANSLTEVGKEAVRLVREEFHKNNKMKNAFQVYSVQSAVNQEHSDGTFVKVKFTMKQTNCRKPKWMDQACTPIKTAKRTYSCLGCFKFDSGGDLLKTGYKKCVRHSDTKKKEVKKERRKGCNKLKEKKEKKEETHFYNEGSFSFRSGPRRKFF